MEYGKLAGIYEQLNETTKRLEKTRIISEFLRETSPEELPIVMLLLEGRIFPSYDPREIGVASRLVLKSINVAAGIPVTDIEREWKKTGDLGLVAENLVKGKKQSTLHSSKLTMSKVFENLRKLATLEGSGTVERKVQLIAELLTSSRPVEAKYVIRTILGNMRIGVGEGVIRDAIVWAFFGREIGIKYNPAGNEPEIEDRDKYNEFLAAVQHAYDVTNDFGPVAKTARTKGIKGLQSLELTVGVPLKVMLAIKTATISEAFETVGKPAAVEFKYDGFRIQAHKDGDEVRLFTRRLENVTDQFPDVAGFIRHNVKGRNFIIDSEAVGLDRKSGKYLPFQSISQRIKRKYGIEQMSKDF
ncbi:ATP-dependent DNA ligase, partial [Candidatus Woesearchaeota archaeon]|nr:ATP-dependent DNA ligase [Candidatus Woesearchaeota archaeon]